MHKRRLLMKKTIIFAVVFSFTLSFNGLLFAKDDSSADLSYPEIVGDVL